MSIIKKQAVSEGFDGLSVEAQEGLSVILIILITYNKVAQAG